MHNVYKRFYQYILAVSVKVMFKIAFDFPKRKSNATLNIAFTNTAGLYIINCLCRVWIKLFSCRKACPCYKNMTFVIRTLGEWRISEQSKSLTGFKTQHPSLSSVLFDGTRGLPISHLLDLDSIRIWCLISRCPNASPSGAIEVYD